MANPYVNLEDIIEPIVAQFKTEIDTVDDIDEITEGESVYEGEGNTVWVIPGEDNIEHAGMQQLLHKIAMYVVIISTSPTATLPELREKGEEVYDKLMEDITHSGTCWKCIPRRFHPGFMAYGEQVYAGVLITFEAWAFQTFVPP